MPVRDKRVQRSRAALLAAAVRLVSARGTTAIPVTDLADAANVSRQLVYLQFGDRDAVLVAAAADLVTRELIEPRDDARAGALATARHFAAHRPFYRAMLTGSCAYAMTLTLNGLFGPINQRLVAERHPGLAEDVARDLAVFLTGGAGAVINDWLVNGPEPLDPQELADRLLRITSVIQEGRAR